jgi:hypothetical protein
MKVWHQKAYGYEDRGESKNLLHLSLLISSIQTVSARNPLPTDRIPNKSFKKKEQGREMVPKSLYEKYERFSIGICAKNISKEFLGITNFWERGNSKRGSMVSIFVECQKLSTN